MLCAVDVAVGGVPAPPLCAADATRGAQVCKCAWQERASAEPLLSRLLAEMQLKPRGQITSARMMATNGAAAWAAAA